MDDLWELWMRHADQALEDEALLLIVQQELAKHCKKSKTRGRPGTTAEIILRARVLTRVMKKMTAVAGQAGTAWRDRSRSIRLSVVAIARASRNKAESGGAADDSNA